MNHPKQISADGMVYTRRDPVTARIVYKAQVILRLLGRGAARAFMRGMRLDPTLIERVLRAPDQQLRR